MENQEKQSGADDLFEESLRQILSNDSASRGGPLTASINGASKAAAGGPPSARRAADDAAVAEKIRKEQKILFWMNMLRPIAVISVLALLGLFALRILNLGR